MHQKMLLQGRVTHKAFAANVAGKGVGVSAVDTQVLIQLVFFPEGLATMGAFKRTETFPDEKVLQRCILKWKIKRDSQGETHNMFYDNLSEETHGKKSIDAI